MKKDDLKKLIKPVVKECIHEVLLEGGLLSTIVSEVAQGMQGSILVETEAVKHARGIRTEEVTPIQPTTFGRGTPNRANTMDEHRRKLMESINAGAYNGVNLFEDTQPMTAQEASGPKQGSVDLGDPGDAGVDISSIIGSASKIWNCIK